MEIVTQLPTGSASRFRTAAPCGCLSDGSASFVGQRTGTAYSPPGPPDPCDPHGVATVDEAYRRPYPRVARYLYDRVFTSGFEVR
jgi:hypothetical protein